MKITTLSIIFLITVISSSNPYEFDFGSSASGSEWMIINDDVMGGRSRSKAILLENSILFEGEVSLENNGGFVSFRSPMGKFDLSSIEKVNLRFRSPGRKFAIMLEDSRRFYDPHLKYEFEGNENNKWEELSIDFSEFKEYRLGEFTGNHATKERWSDILRIGFILFDKMEGPFKIEIDYLEFE